LRARRAFRKVEGSKSLRENVQDRKVFRAAFRIGKPSGSKRARNHQWERAMSWKAPKIVEIALGAEINSYACADARK
jgi:coenzyme PQQ precursor peptide PqqA